MPISRRKTSFVLLFITILWGLLSFQNCSGSGGNSSTAVSTSPLLLSLQQANCNSAISTPVLTGVYPNGTTTPAAEVTIKSGLGSTSSGDSRSVSFDYEVNRGIINSTVFESLENNCNSHLNIQLICEVVANNPNNLGDAPLSATNAYDAAGNNLLPAKAAIDVANDSFIKNDCQAQLGLGLTKATFKITPATATERCVQSNFWLKLTARSKINGVSNSTRNSEPSYFKVNVNNGCWDETRLKDSFGDLPRVINFGTAVAIHNNWAAVVAPTDDANSALLDVGSVYMYMFDGTNWVQKQKIMLSDASAGDVISAVAIRGNTMVIGSPYRNSRGMAFFYSLSGQIWTRIQQVDAPETNLNQFFAQSISINDRYVFVGAPNYSNSLIKIGAVNIYSYTNAGMTFVKTLYGANQNSAFGSAIAVDDTVLSVGAPQALGKESLAPGSVYIFDEAGGTFNLVATKVGTINAEKFGSAITVYGNKLAVGSPQFAVNNNAGFGRVTYYDNYSLAATKTLQGGTAGDNLGQSVAFSNTGLYVGVPYSNTRAGRVDHYLYAGLAAGTLYFRSLAYNESANSAFGYAIATSGNYIIIGARIKNDPNDNSGAAYINKFK